MPVKAVLALRCAGDEGRAARPEPARLAGAKHTLDPSPSLRRSTGQQRRTCTTSQPYSNPHTPSTCARHFRSKQESRFKHSKAHIWHISHDEISQDKDWIANHSGTLSCNQIANRRVGYQSMSHEGGGTGRTVCRQS